MSKLSNICPVCGFPDLEEPAYSTFGDPSFEICPCCGFQFGYDDDDKGFTFETYRSEWLERGARYFCKAGAPENWNLEKAREQLLNL